MNPLQVPMSRWMHRWASRHLGKAAPTTLTQPRVEICPPELWPSSLSLSGRLRRWTQRLVQRATPYLPEPARPVNRLALVKAEFREMLGDLPSHDAQALLENIERARSLRELWHLRSSVYNLVAMELTQGEAERRLAQLNRHFPARAPRSGLVPLQS